MAINYGKVIGRFLGVVEDGLDSNDDPDFSPLSGTVTFTPSVSKVLATSENPPVSIFPQVIKATLDSDGYLTHNFKRGVKLLSPTGDINPSGWTWTVSFDLKQGTKAVSASSFSFELPSYEAGPDSQNPDVGSTAVDLATVSPVSSSTGSAIVRGEQGDSVTAVTLSPDETALVFTIGTEESSVAIPTLSTFKTELEGRLSQSSLDSTYATKDEIGAIGSKIFIDTDGVPYFDPLDPSAGISIGVDTDGTPYIIGEI